MEVKHAACLAVFILVAAMAAPAFAAGGSGAAMGKTDPAKQDGNMLQARVQHLSCTIDFSTTVMGEVAGAIPGGSSTLASDIAKLNADKSQLSTLASAGDPKAFDDFVSGTLTSDTKQGVSDLHAARQGFKSENITNGTMAQLKSEYDAAHGTLATCNSGAASALLQARISQFTVQISDWDSKISTFGQKGFDIAAMQAVASGATSSVVAPLQSALASGDNTQMKAALQTYCLGDGCGNEKNASIQPYDYHGYARMALETLQAMVNNATNDQRIANLTAAGASIDQSKLDDAKQQLDSVRSTLSTVGTAKYTKEQDQSIQNGLKQASQDMKDYQQGVRDSMKKLRQERAAARGNLTGRNFGNRTGNFTGGPGAGGRNFGNRSNGSMTGNYNRSRIGGSPPGNRSGGNRNGAGNQSQ